MSREPGRTLHRPPSCCWMCVLKCVSGGWAGGASGWQGREDEQAWGSHRPNHLSSPWKLSGLWGRKLVGSGDGGWGQAFLACRVFPQGKGNKRRLQSESRLFLSDVFVFTKSPGKDT